jgi:hypothetical protein
MSKVTFDEKGNLVTGRAILEEIAASSKSKLVLVEHSASGTPSRTACIATFTLAQKPREC